MEFAFEAPGFALFAVRTADFDLFMVSILRILGRRKSRLGAGERLAENACAGNRRSVIFGGVLGRVKREEKSIGRRAADDAHLTDAAFESALGGFQFENHSTGDDTALHQAFALETGDGGENFLA